MGCGDGMRVLEVGVGGMFFEECVVLVPHG